MSRNRTPALLWKRALYSLIALFGLITGVFFLARLSGSPAALYLPPQATPQMINQFNHLHGFDKPFLVQYWTFLNDAVHLNLGDSLYQSKPALDVVLNAYPPTLVVAVLVLAVGLSLGLVLGCVAAACRYTFADRAIVSFALAMASAPQFWIALVGILVFSVKLGWLPTSGLSGPSSYVLPVLTLSLYPAGVVTQVARGAMIDALGSSYVLRSRALGLGGLRVAGIHALRNAALPIVTVGGDQAAQVLNGVVIVSSVFALPGIGEVLYNSVLNRDYDVIQTTVLVTGAVVILLNLVIDLLYLVLDPRVRVA